MIEEYFNWLLSKIDDENYTADAYNMTLEVMFNTKFTPIVESDINRVKDAINLRYLFARSQNYIPSNFMRLFDDDTCSVLELMVSVALTAANLTCDEHDNYDADYWFWSMFCSLGLDLIDDRHFDLADICEILYSFVKRTYSRTGKGGLFEIDSGIDDDMRDYDIWYQMCRKICIEEKL